VIAPRRRARKEIEAGQVASARELLARGGSVLAVAIELGLSHETVTSIRDGVHVSDRLGERARYCSGCGHTTTKPCRICATRQYLADQCPPVPRSPLSAP